MLGVREAGAAEMKLYPAQLVRLRPHIVAEEEDDGMVQVQSAAPESILVSPSKLLFLLSVEPTCSVFLSLSVSLSLTSFFSLIETPQRQKEELTETFGGRVNRKGLASIRKNR